MTLEQKAILEYIIYQDGNCVNISCSTCCLRQSYVIDEYFECITAGEPNPLGNRAEVKKKAIEALVAEGYIENIVEILL